MMNQWISKRIGDIGIIVTGKTPSTAVAENFGGKYPFITIPDLDGRREITSAIRTLSEQGAKVLQTCCIPKGAVMISCIATIGKCGIATQPSFTNQQINSVICGEHVNSQFLYYIFTQLTPELESYGGGGSVYTNVSKSRLAEIKIMFPPLPEQKAIAHILGTLDDKIELNRRMNETLEAIAQAIFRDWFVDFGPTRAKMAGHAPYLASDIWDLFPDKLDKEGNPQGWEIKRLDEICESITSGGTPARKTDSYWTGGTIPWFKTGELNDGYLINSKEHITANGLDNSSSKLWQPGTILFALYASPTVGRLGILTIPATANQAAAGIVAKKTYGTEYLKRHLFAARSRLQHIAVGAAQQNINLSVLKDYATITPPEKIARAYSSLIKVSDNRQINLAYESQSLAQIRDLLLPKLISGKINLASLGKIAGS